ncbi:MAG: 2-succinyl-5-enolpyruvyl-6-hydroxy-3-cyclohexene-1-carboxylic-acid synthase [Verrucomicrobia bacterium]|nr:2-succinyl-5-enolpyruvyl-6-hydroxy-3-cyclohexene-1-carboxylic-acid synthase [Verrucomicrobiota bacterium]MDA1067567.1 2-succinyl-5-enolpyruvyl-6-hydroxy-3-cyclohexene-1-carboxylic-acid synthase [Verrucomicrobiota bacterium]
MTSINSANTNTLWSSVLVETLYRCGLRHVVISPGSRSTPLTVAFAAHEGIDAIPILDERSAGFFALGIAKKTHKPVALVCTSGTAGANYFPAFIEASEAGVPLIVLTADRPPELRNCGAGQTINQIRLYGDFPVFQTEMEIPSPDLEDLNSMKIELAHAFSEALKGPVHLNCPFRDPLPPIEDGSACAVEIEESFFDGICVSPRPPRSKVEAIQVSTNRGIIICGTDTPENPLAYCEAVAQLSEASGWPVLADGLSSVRNFASLQSRLVTTYDLLLRNTDLRNSLRPEQVIALGPLPTSKVLRAWLTESKASMYHIHRTGKNLDPTGTVERVFDVPVSDVNACFNFIKSESSDYSDNWLSADFKIRMAFDNTVGQPVAKDFEGVVAWLLPQLLPNNTPIFVASSMPVRDVEYFWSANDKQFQVYASRGANGIDGTLSTALGVAYENKPSILLTGDLAFLHDSNGLLIRPKFKGHLTVIMINNQGGGIFNHLPISQFEPPFEEFFATPQEVDFKPLVESTGCTYKKLSSITELKDHLDLLPDSGIRVIEIETNRKKDSEFRLELFKTISASL